MVAAVHAHVNEHAHKILLCFPNNCGVVSANNLRRGIITHT